MKIKEVLLAGLCFSASNWCPSGEDSPSKLPRGIYLDCLERRCTVHHTNVPSLPSVTRLAIRVNEKKVLAFTGPLDQFYRIHVDKPIPEDLLPYLREPSEQEVTTFNRIMLEGQKYRNKEEASMIRLCVATLDQEGNYVVKI